MMAEAAPEFSKRFPEAAAIFDNLHMLHDNLDDVLSSPDIFPILADKRAQILRILQIYLHRNHSPQDRHAEYHAPVATHEMHKDMGPRPPSVQDVLEFTPQSGLQKEAPYPHPHGNSHGSH
jgi:hypothetical protein